MAPYFEKDPEGRGRQMHPGDQRSFLSILHRKGGPSVEVHFESDTLAEVVVPGITIEAENGTISPFAIPFNRQGFKLRHNGDVFYNVYYQDFIDFTPNTPTTLSGPTQADAKKEGEIRITEPTNHLKAFVEGLTSRFIADEWQFAHVDIDPEGILTVIYVNPKHNALIADEPFTPYFLKLDESQNYPIKFLEAWCLDTDVVNTLLIGTNLRAMRVIAEYQRLVKLETPDYSDPAEKSYFNTGVAVIVIPLQTLDEEIETIKSFQLKPAEEGVKLAQEELIQRQDEIAELEAKKVNDPIDLFDGLFSPTALH